jgi:hypothetical protein
MRYVLRPARWEKVPEGLCANCDELVEDPDLVALTMVRFKKLLCRPHFKEALDRGKV